MNKSKSQLQEAERSQAILFEKLEQAQSKADAAKQELDQLTDAQTAAQDELNQRRARSAQLKATRDDAREVLQTRNARLKELRDELAGCSEYMGAETKGSNTAIAAHQRLGETCSALRAVREELHALSSDSARLAAMDAAGGDITTDVVPPSVPPVAGDDTPDLHVLWLATGGGCDANTAELRPALQSQAVLSMLQRSLVVRAAELREGLRQLSFTCSAIKRAEELTQESTTVQQTSVSETSACLVESEQFLSSSQADALDFEEFRSETLRLQQRLESTVAEHNESSTAVAALQKECVDVRANQDATLRSLDSVKFNHEQKQRDLEARERAILEHDAEAMRRSDAAERLAATAEQQAVRARNALDQSSRELDSVREAQSNMVSSFEALGIELERTKDTHCDLAWEHDLLRHDLHALARHYQAKIPLLPELGDAVPTFPGDYSI